MTKKEEQFFVEMGVQDYKKGIPCHPYLSETFTKIWKREPVKSETTLCEKYNFQSRLWMQGWTTANLAVDIIPE